MADFMVNLWEGVFTPGATPALLLATNITFAALQLTLAGLLAATYSIHFVILSFLCGGLWWAINWFAYELQQAQQKEAEADRIRKSRSGGSTPKKSGSTSGGDIADDEATEAEVETAAGVKLKVSHAELDFTPSQEDERIKSQILNDFKSGTASSTSAGTTALQPSEGESRQRKGPSDMSASSNEFGTDSEWIKVDEE
ncbi:Pkr1-domain-containing protein [Aureobasidium subglaciale]|nr:Pkr1-domain-containing protein [Aureobasidium subglaciale]